MKTKISGLIILLLITVSCTDKAREEFKKSYKESYDVNFRKSFRKSFMKSCIKDNKSAERETFCICIVDDLLENYTTEQLNDSEKIKIIIKNKIVPKCTTENNND